MRLIRDQVIERYLIKDEVIDEMIDWGDRGGN